MDQDDAKAMDYGPFTRIEPPSNITLTPQNVSNASSQNLEFETYSHPLDAVHVKALFITAYIIVFAMCIIGKKMIHFMG